MLTFLSPAKINLTLRVLRKRNDGYHELESLFQAVSLFDTLSFERNTHDRFSCTDETLPLNEQNLVIQARDLFRKKTGINESVAIHLKKEIPSQAGLGGGSGNGATTLFALNQLFGTQIADKKLQEWSSEIGSDLPFFFSEGHAVCRGRGEKVENLPSVFKEEVTLVKPSFGLSTPAVYGALKWPLPSEKKEFFNDLEEAACSLEPRLLSLKQELQKGGFHTVILCGSGSTYFCLGQGALPPHAWARKVMGCKRNEGEWYHAV